MPAVLRSWWILALRGALAVIFGVAVLANPELAGSVLVLIFGAYALAQGIFVGVEAFRGRWWTRIVAALVGIGAGIFAFAAPVIALTILVYFIAAWAMMTGILELVSAAALRRHIQGEWLLAASGVFAVLFGVVLIMFPEPFLWLIGAFAFIFGALQIALALRIRAFLCRSAA